MPEPKVPEPKEPETSYFADSDQVDPTPGWIPFVCVIGIAVLFLIGFVGVAIFVR